MEMKTEDASFRDRDGYIFSHEGLIYRSISPSYFDNYNLLKDSGLLKALVDNKKLIAHQEVSNFTDIKENLIIQPIQLPFISYPYEWSFYQLKRAALLTLEIQLESLNHGMSLKDATAFNVQFVDGKPIFIDTLSFEKFNDGTPWQAYKQFCQHFLAPLVLQVYGIEDLNKLQVLHIDGIPLELTSKILPFRSKLNLSIYSHIHLNAKYEKKYKSDTSFKSKKIDLPKSKQINILNHLKSMISGFKLPKSKTNWTDYYNDFSYNSENIQEKKDFVSKTIANISPKTVIDSGSNTGLFSEIASKFAQQVISFDFDASVIHNQCKQLAKNKITNIIPLIVDMSNPTPAIGWANKERKSFIDRLPNEATSLSLALIHHLVLSNNLSFELIAKFYATFSLHLIIEFVPKDDPQSQRLLVTKKDVFDDYTIENFEQVFQNYFKLITSQKFSDSKRVIYNFEKR
ncbi:MAG: SAM-dependent methyltransferase [Flavobacteriia bacterium]|nr:SAM-dependent methyltransferase [Flavobacteriia bacterium]